MTNTPEFPESASTENVDTPSGGTATMPRIPPPPAPIVQPARPRSNGWALFFGLIAAGMATILVGLLGVFAFTVAVIVGIASGDIDVDVEAANVELAPTTIEEIPSSIVEEGAHIEIDLTKLDLSELQASDEPIELDIEADYGSITVIVPNDVDVSVDASSELGDITVFDDSAEGFGNVVTHQNDDADIALELDLELGDIEVIKG